MDSVAITPQAPHAPLARPARRGALTSGQLGVLLMLALGLVGVVVSQLYYAARQDLPIAIWGRANLVQMLQSPRVEGLRLQPLSMTGTSPPETLQLLGTEWQVTEQREATNQRGLSWLRTSLAVDRNYLPAEPTTATTADTTEPTTTEAATATAATEPRFEYALRFHGEQGPLTLAIAPNCQRLVLVETGAEATMKPVMPGIVRIMQELFPPTQAQPDQ